jgi:hypothetical protein
VDQTGGKVRPRRAAADAEKIERVVIPNSENLAVSNDNDFNIASFYNPDNPGVTEIQGPLLLIHTSPTP